MTDVEPKFGITLARSAPALGAALLFCLGGCASKHKVEFHVRNLDGGKQFIGVTQTNFHGGIDQYTMQTPYEFGVDVKGSGYVALSAVGEQPWGGSLSCEIDVDGRP